MKQTEIVKGGVYEDLRGRRVRVNQVENRSAAGAVNASYADDDSPWVGPSGSFQTVEEFASQMSHRIDND